MCGGIRTYAGLMLCTYGIPNKRDNIHSHVVCKKSESFSRGAANQIVSGFLATEVVKIVSMYSYKMKSVCVLLAFEVWW